MRGIRAVRQKDAMQCGVACLCMICRHYGMDVSIDHIERICHPSREGVSMLAISESAGHLGLECAAGKITADDLAGIPLPAILHWNQNHFVVLYKVKRDGSRFHIADPAKGKITYGRDEFLSHWISTGTGVTGKGVYDADRRFWQ